MPNTKQAHAAYLLVSSILIDTSCSAIVRSPHPFESRTAGKMGVAALLSSNKASRKANEARLKQIVIKAIVGHCR